MGFRVAQALRKAEEKRDVILHDALPKTGDMPAVINETTQLKVDYVIKDAGTTEPDTDTQMLQVLERLELLLKQIHDELVDIKCTVINEINRKDLV